MAMLWMVVAALVAACDGHPGLIRDLDDEFYSEVRDLLNQHSIPQVSVWRWRWCRIGTFGRPPSRKHALPFRKYELVLTKINTRLNAPTESHNHNVVEIYRSGPYTALCVPIATVSINTSYAIHSMILFNSIFETNKIPSLNTIKHHKTHFTLAVNSYMFRHQGAVFREFIKKEGSLSPTRISGAGRPHLHHTNYKSSNVETPDHVSYQQVP